MKSISVFFCCLFFLLAGLQADTLPVDKKIMNYLFDAQYYKADSLLNIQLKKYPDSPKYYSLKAQVHFYSRYFVPNNVSRDSLWLLVEGFAKKAIETGEKIDKKSTADKFYLGNAYGYLSRYQVRHQQLWDGYWSAWDCEEYLEEVIKEDPEFFDAYLGLGVLEYYPAVTLDGFMKAMAWLTGVSGDKEKGWQYFHTVAEKGVLFKDEAKFILGTMYRFQENDFPKAMEIFTELHQKFPGNGFVNNLLNQTRFVQLFEDKGTEFLTTEFDSLGSKYQINNPGILNNLGYYFMGNERYDEALAIFKANIKLFPDVANGYDSLAECYLNMGNEELSVKYYKIAYKKFDTDATASDEFKQRVKDGIRDRLSSMGVDIHSE